MEIIAHRGASCDAPENTLAAIRLAWVQEADAVEVDVHLTRDERLAVIHDPDTQRTGGQAKVVRELTSDELRTVDVGAWKAPGFAGERVPMLDDVLPLVPAGRRIFIELKGGPETVPALVRCLVRGSLQPSQVVVISFDFATARQARAAVKGGEVCWIIERESDDGRRPREELLRMAREARLDGFDLEADWVDESWVQQTRAAGFKLYVWTVDDARLAQRLTQAGVVGITTNRPSWLREEMRL